MQTNVNEDLGAAGRVESLRLELECCQRELDRCQKGLARMDGLFAHVADAFFVLECDGKILDVNPAASALLGYSREELLTMHPWDFVTSVPHGEILATIDSLKSGAASLVQRVCRSKNGEEKVVSLSLRRNSFCGRDLVVATGRDVTHEHRARANLEKAVSDRERAENALRQSEDYLRLTIDTIPVLAWCNRADGSNEFLNKRWLDYTGLSLEQGRGWGWQAAIHLDDLPRLIDLCHSTRASGESGESEARLRRFDGAYRWFLFRIEPLRDDHGRIVKWYGTNTDIDAHKRSEALLLGEKDLTEMIARGDSLDAILNGSCLLAEKAFEDSLAIVMLLDPKDNRLRGGAAPSFPDFMAAVDGFEIDPAMGTCSAAAARREQVITHDISTDPHWADYREVASRHGVRAGWATPILSSAGRVLGTFALYWTEPRSPSPHHLQIISQIARLVTFAMDRKQAAEALQASEKLARGQAAALTQALDALAKETDPDKILEHVLRTVIAQLDADSDSVWLKGAASELMVFKFGLEDGRFKTKSEAAIAAITPSLPVQAFAPWREIFRTGKPSVMEDIREGPEFPWRTHVLARGIVTILWVPMLIAGKVEGVVGVRFAHQRTFRPEELELAQSVANQAMLAIQLARLSGQSRQTAVIEERNRMARDIHDTLAQGFTGVIMHLEAAEEAMSRGKTEILSSHLRGAGETAREGLREARRSVQALRPMALEDKKLGEALKGLIEKMTIATPVHAEVAFQGEPRELTPEWEANMLRVAQEALTNVLRHAGATQFNVLLAFDDFDVRLRLQDNGRGFDPGKRHDGFGLQGMRERVENMGGELSFQSAAGQGTVVSILLPLPSISSLERS